MTITIEQKSHGAAFKELIDGFADLENPIYYNIASTKESRSGYVIEIIPKNQPNTNLIRLGVFIKHCSSRRTPWRYSFTLVHQMEMEELKDECDELFLVLVAGDDGIACIDSLMLKEILDEKYEEMEWISLSRKPRASYRIAGTDGKLSRTLRKRSFPDLLLDHLNTID